MSEKIIVCVDTEETIISFFQQYCLDHELWSSGPMSIDEIKRNISIFSGYIENYLIDHYGLDLEEDIND